MYLFYSINSIATSDTFLVNPAIYPKLLVCPNSIYNLACTGVFFVEILKCFEERRMFRVTEILRPARDVTVD